MRCTLPWGIGHDVFDCGQKAIEIGSQQRNPVHDYHSVGKLLSQGGRYELAKEYLERIDSTNQHYLYRPGTYWHTVWLIEFANLYVAWQQPNRHSSTAIWRGTCPKAWVGNCSWTRLKAEGSAQMQLAQWQEARKNLTQAYALSPGIGARLSMCHPDQIDPTASCARRQT